MLVYLHVLLACHAASSAKVAVPVYSLMGEHIFDGRTEAQCVDADVGASSQLPMAGSPYTMEAWVMPEELSHTEHRGESFGIMGWGVPGWNQLNGFIFFLNSKSLRNIWWQNDLQANLEKPLADGSYHHVAASWDGKVQRIFVDSVEVAQKEATGYGVQKKDNFCIGVAWHWDGSRAKFRGKIKDVKIWNFARDVTGSSIARTQEVEPVGAIYTVHTKLGFLNIHSEPGDPFRLDNVVGKWSDGEVIKVIGEPAQTEFGPWLQTAKGWSIQIYGDFQWLRPVTSPSETTVVSPSEVPVSISSTSVNPSAAELEKRADFEGVLSLQVQIPKAVADPTVHAEILLSAHTDTLLGVVRAHFGLDKVWLTAEVDIPSGRHLRSSLASTSLRFSAQGDEGKLANGEGLQTKIQGALNAAGADITLHSASVKWLSPGPPLSPQKQHKDCNPGERSWPWQLICGIAGALSLAVVSILVCRAVANLRRMTKVQTQKTSPDLERHVDVLALPKAEAVDVDNAKKNEGKGEDIASESTAEGDAGSQDGASSSGSLSRVASEEELGPALYPKP